MKHRRCSECGKKFSHETTNSVEQALRMHMQRSHAKTCIPPGTNGTPKAEPVELTDRTALLLEQPDEPRKRYTRKPKSVEVSVNYCPQCGCNLHNVAVGLAMNTQ